MALPLLILFILKGSLFLFTIFTAVLSLLGLAEFYRMAMPERRLLGVSAATAGGLLPLLLTANELIWCPVSCADKIILPILSLTVLILLFGTILLFNIRDIRVAAAEIAYIGCGYLYVPLLLTHLVWLRALPNGMEWVFLLLLIVMAGDTGAYYVGCNFGRHKLYPIVSPNKSIEGSLGGVAGSIAGAFIARATFFPALGMVDCMVAAILLGSLGQIGDLFESLLKRSFGVKDSGVIVPGHGGILDRLDSILFAAPAAFYYAYFIFLRR